MKSRLLSGRAFAVLAVVFVCSTLPAIRADAETLYDGALGTLPDSQGWSSLFLGATDSLSGGAVVFDSTGLGNNGRGGYTRSDKTLNTNAGYTLTLDLQALAENHASADRSGVSLIVLGNDSRGIELTFWENEVWAQDDTPVLFQHGEGVAFDTKTARHSYALKISSSGYGVFADGGASPILTGALKDYSAFGLPYNLTNYLFIGDDTRSARGSFALSKVTLTEAAAAPEPASASLTLFAAIPIGAGLARRKFNVRRRP